MINTPTRWPRPSWNRYAAYEMTLWGVATGDARLRPGAPVDIVGVANAAAGRYVLTEVTHLVNTVQGFVSELSSARRLRPAVWRSPPLLRLASSRR